MFMLKIKLYKPDGVSAELSLDELHEAQKALAEGLRYNITYPVLRNEGAVTAVRRKILQGRRHQGQ